jgi:hypothetical protein
MIADVPSTAPPVTLAMLLAELEGAGVVFTLDGEQVRFRAPRGVLTVERLAAVRAHKPVLLALLRARQRPQPPELDPARLAAAIDVWERQGRPPVNWGTPGGETWGWAEDLTAFFTTHADCCCEAREAAIRVVMNADQRVKRGSYE